MTFHRRIETQPFRLPGRPRSIGYDRVTGDPARRMRILYVIFVLCVGALLWTAFAAARHIRRHEAKAPPSEEKPPFAAEQRRELEVLVPSDKGTPE